MSRDRGPAYSELLQSLLGLRPDLAGERFDQLLTELLAADRIDPEAARELRWWQRESVRAVSDYLDQTAPALLAALESSYEVAGEATRVAADAWQRATAAEPGHAEAGHDEDGHDDAVHGAEADQPHEERTQTGAGRSHGGSGAAGPVTPGHAAGGSGADVVIDLRAGRGRETGPTSPSATATLATGGGQPAVASPRSRLLITGRSLQPERRDNP